MAGSPPAAGCGGGSTDNYQSGQKVGFIAGLVVATCFSAILLVALLLLLLKPRFQRWLLLPSKKSSSSQRFLHRLCKKDFGNLSVLSAGRAEISIRVGSETSQDSHLLQNSGKLVQVLQNSSQLQMGSSATLHSVPLVYKMLTSASHGKLSSHRYSAAWKRRETPGLCHKTTSGVSESREVTIVVTDVEGSTELWEWDDKVMTEGQEMHDHLMRALIYRYYGHEITTEGDSFIIAFHDARDATAWALHTQLALMILPWPAKLLTHKLCEEVVSTEQDTDRPGLLLFRGLRIRVGMNTGTPTSVTRHEVTQTLQYKGPVFDLAAAVSDLPAGGQILMAPNTFSRISQSLHELGKRVPSADLYQRAQLASSHCSNPPSFLPRRRGPPAWSAANRFSRFIPPQQRRKSVSAGGQNPQTLWRYVSVPSQSTSQLSFTADPPPDKDSSTILIINEEEMRKHDLVTQQRNSMGGNELMGFSFFHRSAATSSLSTVQSFCGVWSGKTLGDGTASAGNFQAVDRLGPDPFRAANSSEMLDGTGSDDEETYEEFSGMLEKMNDVPMVIDMGCHLLDGGTSIQGGTGLVVQGDRITQIISKVLSARTACFPPLVSVKQLAPSFFDAPLATSALLPFGKLFGGSAERASSQVCMAFCSPANMKALEAENAEMAKDALALFCSSVRHTLFACRGSYECQEKDGVFMMAFLDPALAVQWAVALQIHMLAAPWSEALLEHVHGAPMESSTGVLLFRGMRSRVGIYSGEITRIIPHCSTGRADYFGYPVNRAARFLAAAGPGQIMIDEEAALAVVKCWDSESAKRSTPMFSSADTDPKYLASTEVDNSRRAATRLQPGSFQATPEQLSNKMSGADVADGCQAATKLLTDRLMSNKDLLNSYGLDSSAAAPGSHLPPKWVGHDTSPTAATSDADADADAPPLMRVDAGPAPTPAVDADADADDHNPFKKIVTTPFHSFTTGRVFTSSALSSSQRRSIHLQGSYPLGYSSHLHVATWNPKHTFASTVATSSQTPHHLPASYSTSSAWSHTLITFPTLHHLLATCPSFSSADATTQLRPDQKITPPGTSTSDIPSSTLQTSKQRLLPSVSHAMKNSLGHTQHDNPEKCKRTLARGPSPRMYSNPYASLAPIYQRILSPQASPLLPGRELQPGILSGTHLSYNSYQSNQHSSSGFSGAALQHAGAALQHAGGGATAVDPEIFDTLSSRASPKDCGSELGTQAINPHLLSAVRNGDFSWAEAVHMPLVSPNTNTVVPIMSTMEESLMELLKSSSSQPSLVLQVCDVSNAPPRTMLMQVEFWKVGTMCFKGLPQPIPMVQVVSSSLSERLQHMSAKTNAKVQMMEERNELMAVSSADVMVS